MKEHFLDFERPLAEIIEKIEALQAASNEDPELLGQIEKLRKEEEKLKNKIFSKLSTWQKVQVARHPQRPHILQIILKQYFQILSNFMVIVSLQMINLLSAVSQKSRGILWW